MLICILTLLLLLPVICLTGLLETCFSAAELAEMGVHLENSHF